MQLFYTPSLTAETKEFEFSKDESQHIIKVLRMKEGDVVYTTNGQGYIFTGRILAAHPQKCRAAIEGHERRHHKHYHLHLAVAPTKVNSRFEWFLEKATEIGIDEITPLFCERSERRVVKLNRLQKVIESAMKQSLRAYLPLLNPPMDIREFIKKEHQGMKFIAHCEDVEKTDLKRRLGADQDVTILIGPEGDFTHQEIKNAYGQGFHPISLGEARLRTETAALMACATVGIINNR